MERAANLYRVRVGALSLAISGILFVLYPAIRPFSDEASLQGAAAFSSTAWLVAHMLAILAFTLLPLGLLGLHSSLQETTVEPLGYWAVVLSLIGTGLTLPFYGGETYGLRAIGQEAVRLQAADLVSLAAVVRSGAGLMMFLVGLLGNWLRVSPDNIFVGLAIYGYIIVTGKSLIGTDRLGAGWHQMLHLNVLFGNVIASWQTRLK